MNFIVDSDVFDIVFTRDTFYIITKPIIVKRGAVSSQDGHTGFVLHVRLKSKYLDLSSFFLMAIYLKYILIFNIDSEVIICTLWSLLEC